MRTTLFEHTGIIEAYTRNGELLDARRYCNKSKLHFVDWWQKMYGKKFCFYLIKPDER